MFYMGFSSLQLLQKMIDDREPSVISVIETGKQQLTGLEGAQRRKMDGEMNNLEKRWGLVANSAAGRMKALEEMAELSHCFQV